MVNFISTHISIFETLYKPCGLENECGVYYGHQISNKSYNFEKEQNGAQSFRWININDLDSDEMTFPIDKKVASLLKEEKVNKDDEV